MHTSVKGGKLSSQAWALWERRSAALEHAAALVSEKPDQEQWTRKDRRLLIYAMAIGKRLDRLN